VVLGMFREAVKGDILPGQVLIVVEWESHVAFSGDLNDPALADLYPHREKGWRIMFGISLTGLMTLDRF